MCGRYTLTTRIGQDIADRFDVRDSASLAPETLGRFNVCPTEPVAVVTAEREARALRWGLVPPWARGEEFTGPTIPAVGRARTISFWVAIVAGALVVAALLTWITTSMMSRNDGADSFAAKPDTLHPAARVIAGPAPTAPAAAAHRDSAPAVAAMAPGTNATPCPASRSARSKTTSSQ